MHALQSDGLTIERLTDQIPLERTFDTNVLKFVLRKNSNWLLSTRITYPGGGDHVSGIYSNTESPVNDKTDVDPTFLKMCFMPHRMYEFQIPVEKKREVSSIT